MAEPIHLQVAEGHYCLTYIDFFTLLIHSAYYNKQFGLVIQFVILIAFLLDYIPPPN